MPEHSLPRRFIIEPVAGSAAVALNLNVPSELTVDKEGVVYNENGTALCRVSWLGEPNPQWNIQPLRTLEADVPPLPNPDDIV